MSSEPNSDRKNTPSNDRLPFDKRSSRKKQPKKPAPTPLASPKESTSSTTSKPASRAEMTIPDVVSKRMVQRMLLFCGIPSLLGILTFIISYWVVIHDWFKLPNIAVVLVSMGFFGLGVLGLSYSVLSASWDEDLPGSKLGWNEFITNWGRMTAAWQSTRQKD